MSILILVRHGQATLDGDDYDRLSPLGHEQARALGEYWAALGLEIDRVLIGPRRRHRETHDTARQAFASAGRPWPDGEPLGALDEHQGPAVLSHHRALLAEEAPGIDAGASPAAPPVSPSTVPTVPSGTAASGNTMREYLRLFRQGSLRWVRGELPTPEGLESWPGFRERVAGGLETIRSTTEGNGQTVVAFTSGGAMTAAVGHVLGLDDDQIMRLSWRVRNGATSEMQFSDRGFGLTTFNAVPHFLDARFLTFV
ncbi:MAG: histidine phosphatase family protein [Holophagales bacterium]|nr:histidine phosphatase family protein [Holophagales bacterium]